MTPHFNLTVSLNGDLLYCSPNLVTWIGRTAIKNGSFPWIHTCLYIIRTPIIHTNGSWMWIHTPIMKHMAWYMIQSLVYHEFWSYLGMFYSHWRILSLWWVFLCKGNVCEYIFFAWLNGWINSLFCNGISGRF